MKFLLQLFLVFILIHCQSNDKNDFNDKISGKWIFADEYFITTYSTDGTEEPPSPPRENFGFNFFSKDSCESNYQYLKIIDSTKLKDRVGISHDNIQNVGRKTIYRINKDSLKVFDRGLNRWQAFKIMKLDNNNFIINENDVIIKKFVRVLKK